MKQIKTYLQLFSFLLFAHLTHPLQANLTDLLESTYLGKLNVVKDGGLIEGEHIDIRSGSVYWETTDFVIPGNGKLDIVINRSLNKTAVLNYGDITNWSLEVPRILLAQEGFPAGRGEVTSSFWKFKDPYTWKGNLCESPYSKIFGEAWPGGFWSGVQLIIPGEAPKELFFIKKEQAKQFPENAWYATTDNWIVECRQSDELKTILQNIDDETFKKAHQNDKDVFLVTAPDGRRFWLDVVERQYGTLAYDPFYRNDLKPAWIIVRASKVEDIHGNNLEYHYHTFQIEAYRNNTDGRVLNSVFQRLKKITSKDGRVVDFFYEKEFGLGLEKITANERTWQYQYQLQGTQVLNKVIRPDGSLWQYQYQGPSTFSYGTYSTPNHLSHVETPIGATIDYTFQPIPAGFFLGVPSRYAIHILASRTVKGPNLKEASWKYRFKEKGGLTLTIVTTPEHREEYIFYRTDDWALGLLHSRTIYNKDDSIPLRKEVYSLWEPGPIFGYSHVPRQSHLFLNNGVQKILKKLIVDEKYTTEYQDHDIYGNPKKVIETGTESRVSHRSYLNKTTAELWLIGLPKDEKIEDGGTILRDYDEKGDLIKLTEYGITTQYEYHPTGDIKTKTWNKDGQELSITYDDYKRGQPQTIQKPENITLKRVINDTGTVSSEEDGEGHITSYEYDSLNRVIKITPPTGESTTIEWKNPRTKITTRGPYQETTLLDALERPIQKIKQDTQTQQKIITKTEYDDRGNTTFQSDFGETEESLTGIQTTFDALNRPLTITHTGDQSTTRYCYDAGCGPPLSNQPITQITNPNGYKTTYLYLAYGDPNRKELTEIKEPTKTTTFSRNKLGNITSITQGNLTRRYEYEKDRPKLLKKQFDPEIGWTHYTYDETGNKTTENKEDQEPIRYSYDLLNRLTKVDYPKGTPNILYRYNKNDQIKDLKRGQTQWHYAYNDNNQLVQESLKIESKTEGKEENSPEQVFALRYTYNALGHLEKTTTPTNLTFTYEPDAFGRATQIGELAKNITYHPNGQQKSILTRNDLITLTTQNKRHWREKVTTKKNEHTLLEQHYQYDKEGNLTQLNDQTFTYDGQSQLTKAEGPWGKASFQYDNIGNITQKTIDQDTLNYHYSPENKLKEITGSQNTSFTYDNKGNLTIKGNQVFAFDEANNLTALINETPKVLYRYDGNHHRTLIQQGDQTKITVHNQEGQLVFEHTPEKQTTYLHQNHQLIARIDQQNQTQKITYYHTDLLGSPIAATNEEGHILWKQGYKPYGERLNPENKDNHLWYTGKTEDKETGFIYLNARYYDPHIARFISPDPVSFTEQNTQSFNRYSYANNNPYKYQDSSGQLPILIPALWGLGAALTAYDAYHSYEEAGGGYSGLLAGSKSLAMGGAMMVGMGLAGRGLSSIFAARKVTVLGENMMERVIPYAQKTGGRTLPFGVSAEEWNVMTPQQRWRLNDGALRARINEGDKFQYIGRDPFRDPMKRMQFDLTRSELIRLQERNIPYEIVSPSKVRSTLGRP